MIAYLHETTLITDILTNSCNKRSRLFMPEIKAEMLCCFSCSNHFAYLLKHTESYNKRLFFQRPGKIQRIRKPSEWCFSHTWKDIRIWSSSRKCKFISASADFNLIILLVFLVMPAFKSQKHGKYKRKNILFCVQLLPSWFCCLVYIL